MRNSLRLVTLAVLAAVGVSVISPTAAHAGKSGRRNTALALGAVAAYGLIKKKPAIAGIAGAGAVYSWIRSNKADDDRNRRRNRNRRNRRYNTVYAGDRYYDNGYRSGYSNRGYRRSYGNQCNTGYGRSSYGRSSYGRSSYGRSYGKSKHGRYGSYSRASHSNGRGHKRGHWK